MPEMSLRASLAARSRTLALTLPLALLLTACGSDAPESVTRNLPWQIEVLPDGHTRVFGIIPGQNTLLEAKRALDQKAEVSLFKAADGTLSLELYYGRIQLGFLDALLITEVDATLEQLKALEAHASNPKAQPSGSWKLDLRFEDYATIQLWKVRSLTYIPTSVQFDADTLEKRFGPPAERHPIDAGREYWFYPDKGLAIMLAEKEKEMLQYVAPSDFPRLKDKLTRELPRSVLD